MKIGIIAAVPEEIQSIHDDLHFHHAIEHAERTFHLGRYQGIELVLVISRVGKVAGSITASALIEKFGVDSIIFTGLAGAVSKDLHRGDIVLAQACYQHDVDARPLCEQPYEIALTHRRLFAPRQQEFDLAKKAIEQFLCHLDYYVNVEELKRLNIHQPAFFVCS